jgi:ESCRT-II complex subunit VPS36
VGVAGIIRQHDLGKRSVNSTVESSFTDLEALMGKARAVVDVMGRYQAQVSSEAVTTTADEEGQLRSLLMAVGIKSPVTKSASGAGAYHGTLARELADFLLRGGHLSRAGGMLTLPDVYALFNRARGLVLVSPDDLVECCSCLAPLNLGVSLRTFDSGVVVLQADSQGVEAMGARLKSMAPLTLFSVATTLDIPLELSREHVHAAERHGFLCRDDSGTTRVFFPNRFDEFLAEARAKA